jgi:1,4-dihydroxy-2-naphthoate polyprenyltransferase
MEQMNKSSYYQSWMKAARPRTLPLALASIITGSALAWFDGAFNGKVFALASFTAIFLQILSNLANDYGDSVRGIDNDQRVGPMRTVQSGEITPSQMRIGIAISVLASFVTGIWLIAEGIRGLNASFFVVFLLLGVASIVAALKYTMGRNPYGYAGLGDISVFLFFGQTGVLGTYFLHTHHLSWGAVLMAFVLGLFSMGVLNLNNMRDIENDINCGKLTLAARIGLTKAKIYHAMLILLGLAGASVFLAFYYTSAWQLIFLLVFPKFIIDLKNIFEISENQKLDPFLKKLSISTFVFAILFGTGLILSLC